MFSHSLSSLRNFLLSLPLTAATVQAALPVGENLLVNGSAAEAMPAGWTVIAAGGNGWGRGGGGHDAVPGYFITSWGVCRRSQVIDLLAAGATAEELDAAPPIRVSEAISSYLTSSGLQAGVDTYYIRVELRNAEGGVVAAWDAGTSAARKPATGSWVVESHEFRDYGPGVRSVYFEDGGMDGGNWAGHYGTWHDAARVEFLNQPVTDITAAPAGFAANVSAGGIVAQLTAVDTDDSLHTFVLEPEVVISTQELLAASADGWRYYDQAVPPPAHWMTTVFDDSLWASGPAPLGYDSTGADNWKQTQLSYGADANNKPLTTWFRKTFELADPTVVGALSATLMVDDGCVVYLNGQELFRDGMAEGIVTDTTPANRGVSGGDENDYDPVVIPAEKLALLVPGTNVLAVEVHQDRVTSSDLSIDLTLTAEIAGTVTPYDNDLFTITGSGLHLTGGSAALATGPYTVRVRASDPAGNSLVKLLTIQRTDSIFTHPPADLNLSASMVAENTPAGTSIATLSVTDADAGDVHAFSLAPGGGDNAWFSIAGNRLVLAQSPDYEADAVLSILVQAADSTGLTVSAPFTVTITDNNTEDTDKDGLTEAEEDLNDNGVLEDGETDPLVADTDGDTYNDGDERAAGSDPRDLNDVPSSLQLRQTVTHVTGESWLTASSWEGGGAPGPIHFTLTDNLTLRPPPVPDPYFPGVAAILQNNAVFRLKHTGTLTIPRIVLRNATLQHGMTELISVGGAGAVLEIPTTGIIDVATAPLILSARLSGAGSVRVTGSGAGRLELSAPAQSFTGELILEAPETVLADPAAAAGARRIRLNRGTMRTAGDIVQPGTILQLSETGRLSLASTLTFAALSAEGALLPAGTYSGAQLIAAGVPAAAVDDQAGFLIVSRDPSADTDGDGSSDLSEILAGTDPGDSSSVLRLSGAGIGAAAGTFDLTWTAVPGITYTVQFSDSLNGPWQDLDTVTFSTTAGTYTATPPAPAPDKGFFRLIVK
jgi:hypothetical protein